MSKKQLSCTSDWNELVWPSLGVEMMSSSTEKTVALFLSCTCKPISSLKGRSFDDITIQGKRPLGRSRHSWKNNVEMNHGELGWDGVAEFIWFRLGTTGWLL
jgi:hypothetical protein